MYEVISDTLKMMSIFLAPDIVSNKTGSIATRVHKAYKNKAQSRTPKTLTYALREIKEGKVYSRPRDHSPFRHTRTHRFQENVLYDFDQGHIEVLLLDS